LFIFVCYWSIIKYGTIKRELDIDNGSLAVEGYRSDVGIYRLRRVGEKVFGFGMQSRYVFIVVRLDTLYQSTYDKQSFRERERERERKRCSNHCLILYPNEHRQMSNRNYSVTSITDWFTIVVSVVIGLRFNVFPMASWLNE